VLPDISQIENLMPNLPELKVAYSWALLALELLPNHCDNYLIRYRLTDR
jgi:hypothetical protein